jgi:hypothetical protein
MKEGIKGTKTCTVKIEKYPSWYRERKRRERERSQTENMGQTDRLEADKWLYVAPEILDPRLKALASLTTPCANTGRKQPSVQLTDLYSLQQQSQQKSV